MNYSLLITGPITSTEYLDKFLEEDNKIEIIISTWKDSQNLLEKYKELNNITVIYSNDVGSCKAYSQQTIDKPLNFNRQRILIEKGFKVATREYIIRIRSDIYINIDKILQYKSLMDKGLILTTDISAVNPKLIFSSALHYHPCDWFFGGHKKVFGTFISNLEKNEKNVLTNYYSKIEDREYYVNCTAEQLFCMGINKIKKIPNLFTLNNHHKLSVPTAPIDTGYYILNSKDIQLKSLKYGLRFLHPFRAVKKDNFNYERFRINILEIFAHFIRRLIKYKI